MADDYYQAAVQQQLNPGGAPPVNPRARFYEEMAKLQQMLTQRPDMSEIERAARERQQAAGEDIGPALMLQAMGGRLAPLGGQILKQSLAAREPMKLPGGQIMGGQFVEDPFTQHQRQLQAQEFGVRQLESTATHAEAQAARDAAERRQEARDTRLGQQFELTLAESRARRGEAAAARTEAQGAREEAAASRAEQGRFRLEDSARSHYDQVTKDTRDVLNMGRALTTLPENGRLTPIQQQSFIIMLNKFQDPGSVVREGEFNRVREAQAILQRLGNLPQQIATGQPVPPALMKDIRQVIKLYTDAAENTMRETGREYVRVARSRGLDPTAIVTDPRWRGEGGPGVPRETGPGGGAREIDVGARLTAPRQAGVGPGRREVQVEY